MSNEKAPETADARPAVGGPVQRMVGPDPARDAFESVVAKWTGRDMSYHAKNGTTGLEFAWFCWQQAARQDHERNNADILRQQVADQAAEIERLRVGLSELQRHYSELCRENRPSMALHEAAIAESLTAEREKFGHLKIRLGEVIRERDAMRSELQREHTDHQDTLRDVEALVAAERERWASAVRHAVSELETLDDETAQAQAKTLLEVLGTNAGANRPLGAARRLICKTMPPAPRGPSSANS